MHKKVAKEILKELKEKYPNLKEITIQYEGSGDSFGDFWDWDVEYFDKSVYSEYNPGEIKDEILKIFDDLIDHLFDKVGANFNNDGSEGTITVDLEKLDIKMDCYEKYTETRFEGEVSYFEKE